MKVNIILAALLATVFTFSTALPNAQLNSELKDLVQKRKSLSALKTVLEELDSNLARVYKRGCDINLPGFDCDNSNMIYNGNDADWWSGGSTPGKKRGGCINADGSSCDTAQIAQELSNRRPWINGPGRRKREALNAH